MLSSKFVAIFNRISMIKLYKLYDWGLLIGSRQECRLPDIPATTPNHFQMFVPFSIFQANLKLWHLIFHDMSKEKNGLLD